MATENKEAAEKHPGSDFLVPLESFHNEAVVTAVASTNIVDNHDAYARLRTATAKAVSDGDAESAHALDVLSQISSYHLKPDDRTEPFGPFVIMNGRRSAIPTDLLPDQTDVLARFAPEVEHPSLRARIADVCWLLNKKDSNSGFIAVAGYVECVRSVLCGKAQFDFDETNPACVPASDFLRRALVIARAMGWKRDEFDDLRETISDVSQYALDHDDGWGFIHTGSINLEGHVWTPEKLAKAAELLAHSDKLTDDHLARRVLWEFAARAHHQSKDMDNSNRCLIEAAETYVTEADARMGSAIIQVHFLREAIQALRPIPNTVERRRKLQDRLNEVQPQILDEMPSFSHSTDISELVEATEAGIRQKPLAEVIRALLLCATPPDPELLREEVLQDAYGRIAPTFSTTISDSQGRTRFVAPGLDPSGPPDENQVKFLINQHESIRRNIVVTGSIDPIRRVLQNEHSVSVDSLLPIMQASPFVPPNHEYIFATGAAKFIGGNDLEAAHLILPQLENSLRHILSLAGVETNRINPDGTQEEAMLGRLLETFRGPLSELMSEALIQQIELLFNFRGGPSVRHELAHGKMSDGEFWGPDVTYSIWLVLQIVILPTLRFWDAVAANIAARSGERDTG